MINQLNNKLKQQTLREIAFESLMVSRLNGFTNLYTDDLPIEGGYIYLDNEKYYSFGSCSYLGLELNQKLINGAIDATKKYGPLVSSSRAYVSLGLINELNALLCNIFESESIIVFSSVSMGHISTLSVIFDKKDAVFFDQQSHHSMQALFPIVKEKAKIVGRLKHNDFDRLEQKISELNQKKDIDRIWFVMDGVYSMFGDLVIFDKLKELQAKYKNLYYYIDDAHGMSWYGKNGKGFALSNLEMNDRTVMSISLAKGFGSGGGAIIYPTEHMKNIVECAGGHYTFTGPIYPPTVGAAVESAKIHLSSEIYNLQNKLNERINWTNECILKYNVPIVKSTETPIFFVPIGTNEMCINVTKKVFNDKFHVNVSAYPAVPRNLSGIRFTITNHNNFEDIEKLIKSISIHVKNELKKQNGKLPKQVQPYYNI